MRKSSDKNEERETPPEQSREPAQLPLDAFIAAKAKQARERGQPIPAKLIELFRRQVIHGGHKPANYELLWSIMWGK